MFVCLIIAQFSVYVQELHFIFMDHQMWGYSAQHIGNRHSGLAAVVEFKAKQSALFGTRPNLHTLKMNLLASEHAREPDCKWTIWKMK